MAASQLALFILQFGSSLIVARLLTPYDMGVFAVAVAVAGLISVLRSIGLGSYLVRAQIIDEPMLRSVFTINVALTIAATVAIAAVSILGGILLSEPGVRRALLVMSVMPLINVFELLPAASIERAGGFRTIGAINLGRSLLSVAVLLAFAFAGHSYMSLVYGQIAASVFSAIAFNVVGWSHARLRFGVRDWREIMRYGAQMLAISGVNTLSSRFAEVLLGRFLGLSALGLYSRAAGLNGMLGDNIHAVITRIVFVDFAEYRRRGLSLRAPYLRIVQLITALLWPAFTGMAVIAGPLILMLYGPNWVGAALPLSLLSLSAVVLVSMTMTWEVFVVCEETGRQAWFEFVRAGVGFALFAGGCTVSLTWAAAARLGEALFSLILYRPHLERMTDTVGRDFIAIYASSSLLTLVAITPAATVMSYHGWQPDAPLPEVLGSVAVGVLCWAALLMLMKHPLAQEARMLLGRALPARYRCDRTS